MVTVRCGRESRAVRFGADTFFLEPCGKVKKTGKVRDRGAVFVVKEKTSGAVRFGVRCHFTVQTKGAVGKHVFAPSSFTAMPSYLVRRNCSTVVDLVRSIVPMKSSHG